ncbi:MAG: hypothetical protein F6K25_31695 [Okeania sp. SIO2G4]|uniref:hypothetical protein n=1 Tax=unclassified Okeania TaxID=2634635 RepID=UPI0013BAFAB7|nr:MULTISPECIES: hypothetical protein [unclassified Okeania]NEP07949.1 hypothetical protein [Okeania sp. SIO4D6]NEP39226.1 hypothetical protein [Okeania sp. SIO2H7]NEP75813.1 hypothetical protein [Okeania sp. SIO2G5]NEP97228.1 hypothetical protein [Okeania sp. SIO2F5]NEQ94941.1 hypothetical protein [Okeania sp. SIO2G4]
MTNQVNKRNAVNFLKSLATAIILAPIFMENNSAKAVTIDFESGSPSDVLYVIYPTARTTTKQLDFRGICANHSSII